MERIYLLEEGAYLIRKGDALVVMKGAQRLDEIPASDLRRLVLVGMASMTGPVLDFLISHGVDTGFLTPSGRPWACKVESASIPVDGRCFVPGQHSKAYRVKKN